MLKSKSSIYHKETACFKHDSSLEKIKRVFNFDCKPLKILDLGCGDGRLSGELVKKGHEVWGIDSSNEGLKIAEEKGIKTIKADLESDDWHLMSSRAECNEVEGSLRCGERRDFSTPLRSGRNDKTTRSELKSNSFDVVLLLDVLEHLYDGEKVINNINKILKDDGKLVICLPNHFDLRNRLHILFGGGIVHWDHKRYNNALAWEYGHIRFLRLKELIILLQRCGFYLKSSQFNFMAGGIIPTFLTPRKLRVFLLRFWPNLFSGKFVLLLTKDKIMHPDRFFVGKTKKGM